MDQLSSASLAFPLRTKMVPEVLTLALLRVQQEAVAAAVAHHTTLVNTRVEAQTGRANRGSRPGIMTILILTHMTAEKASTQTDIARGTCESMTTRKENVNETGNGTDPETGKRATESWHEIR